MAMELTGTDDRSHTLFETMPHGVVFQSADGRITFVNPAAEGLLGSSRDELLGASSTEPLWRAIHEDGTDFSPHDYPSMVALSEGKPVHDVIMGMAKPGQASVRWVLVSSVPIFKEGETSPKEVYTTFTDITEMRKAQDELRKSELRFMQLAENMPLVFWLVELPSGKVLYASPAIQTEWGIEAEVFRKNPVTVWLDHVHQEDRKKVLRTFRTWSRNNHRSPSYATEYRMVHADGRVRWVQSRISGISDGNGELRFVSGIVQDITERKQAEAERERLVAILESTSDVVSISRPDGQVSYMNSAGMRLLGWQRGESLSEKRISDLHPRWAYEIILREGMPAAARYGVWVGETALLRKDRTEIPTSQVIMSHKTADGRIEYISTIMRDMSATKRVQRALEESEARYRHLFESAGDAIMVMKNETILDCNRRTLELFMCRRDEILGRTLQELAPAQQPDGTESEGRLMEKIRGALEGRPQVFEWTHLKCDGSAFDTEVTLSAVGLGGGVHLQVIVRDITERKSAEAEKEELRNRLIQAQKMETVGHMAGGIAHDFNNLLAPILAYSEMLLLDLEPNDPRYTQIRTTYEAAQRAKDLVRQLLAYGRKQVLEMQTLDLNEVVSQLAKILRRTLREDIQIELFLAPVPVQMKGDRAQLEQVIMNLVINSQDAMAEAGVLTIETANVILDAAFCASHPDLKPGPYVMLAVSDTGHGMEKETLEHIFEPFFTTKEDGKGTGLGLATVYGIVKQHEGSIRVQSEIDGGTTFKIHFPLVLDESKAASEPDTGIEPESPSETIMVVEDNEMVLDMVAAILREAGYEVVAASDPAACLEALDQHQGPLHLLLTDVVLPDKSGRDLYNELKPRYPHLKVLYMSGYADSVVAQSGALEQGAHFIEKPFSIQELREKIRQTIGH